MAGSDRAVKRYTIVIEQTSENYSAFVPSLPGCIATGHTIEETLVNMREAIKAHLETMAELGIPVSQQDVEDVNDATLYADHAETHVLEIGT